MDFPNEHWYERKIKECFSGLSEVVDIDPVCLICGNFVPLRPLLEVNVRLEIPFEARISFFKLGVGRADVEAKILTIRVWPRAYQLGVGGNVAPFFGPPPPPEHGPSLGPMGPFFLGTAMPPSTTLPHGAYALQLECDPYVHAPVDNLQIDGLMGPWMGSLGLSRAFVIFFVFLKFLTTARTSNAPAAVNH